MNIYLASDHAGFELKAELVSYLLEKGHQAIDCGAGQYDEGDDYTDWIPKAVREVLVDEGSLGIILGGSGEGEAIAANRFKGIRATVYYGGNKDILKLSREHNDANVLSLGARFISSTEAKEAVDSWLAASFTHEERHERRNTALDYLN